MYNKEDMEILKNWSPLKFNGEMRYNNIDLILFAKYYNKHTTESEK